MEKQKGMKQEEGNERSEGWKDRKVQKEQEGWQRIGRQARKELIKQELREMPYKDQVQTNKH